MKLPDSLLKTILLIIAVLVLAFNGLLYIVCEKQKSQIEGINQQLQVESQVNSNRFQYEQEQVARLNKDMQTALQQIKSQKEVLASEKDDSKNTQTALVDLHAEADAIKQQVKGWQRDYASVLAQMEKKLNDSQNEIKTVTGSMAALNELKESINSLNAELEKISANPPPEKNAATAGNEAKENNESEE